MVNRFIPALYFNSRFFFVYFSLAVFFVLAYFYEPLFPTAKILVFALVTISFIDALILFRKKGGIEAERILPDKLSNGDENRIFITVKNHFGFPTRLKIIDELPAQWQIRDFRLQVALQAGQNKKLTYTVRPTERGIYEFGVINIFVSSPIGLLARRFKSGVPSSLPSYPSFQQFKKYDFLAFSKNLQQVGIKKIRKLGETLEFEQIKEYIPGDDVRNLNWKATAKRAELMINQYQDEKSQPVYCLIDKGRVMKMPFDGLSLLDYAINASLVLSNIILKKHDKAGILTFSRKLEDKVKAERRKSQMKLILDALYKVSTDFSESDFSRLYIDVKHIVKHRSLLLLFTNFETKDALDRQLKYLKALNKTHLLVVIFFENTELTAFAKKETNSTRQIFDKIIAEKFIYEKKLIVNELKKHGILSILTSPENLTVNTINKYLEIKARGMF